MRQRGRLVVSAFGSGADRLHSKLCVEETHSLSLPPAPMEGVVVRSPGSLSPDRPGPSSGLGDMGQATLGARVEWQACPPYSLVVWTFCSVERLLWDDPIVGLNRPPVAGRARANEQQGSEGV